MARRGLTILRKLSNNTLGMPGISPLTKVKSPLSLCDIQNIGKERIELLMLSRLQGRKGGANQDEQTLPLLTTILLQDKFSRFSPSG